MKWLRFDDGRGPQYGRLSDADTIEVIDGSPFGVHRATGERVALSRVQLLAPVEVHHVYGVGLNYVNHIKEVGAKTPKIPLLFMKPDSAVVGPDVPVVYPREGQDVHYECELAVVIGKRARRVSAADAPGFVFGYTCANDISERVIQREEMGMG
ncbi:MAG: fumarylacetoacetate hydrolase family protein, partial [Betaproteobacteria bacterium]